MYTISFDLFNTPLKNPDVKWLKSVCGVFIYNFMYDCDTTFSSSQWQVGIKH